MLWERDMVEGLRETGLDVEADTGSSWSRRGCCSAAAASGVVASDGGVTAADMCESSLIVSESSRLSWLES